MAGKCGNMDLGKRGHSLSHGTGLESAGKGGGMFGAELGYGTLWRAGGGKFFPSQKAAEDFSIPGLPVAVTVLFLCS